MSTPTARLSAALADRYQIERELGAGGMATVYLARDLRHQREVALKVLRPELTAVLGAERFLNEIRITARLDHPHILTLIDSGADASFLWYVLPYVRGESLRVKLTRERQLGLEESLQTTRQIASALEYAHQRGVIHRDIKPENILLHEGEAVLADFGIALAVKEAGGNRVTETGLSLGTPQYMSPEQATGDRQLDARSDVYSLGAVLYEMLAGEPPHSGPSAQAIIAKLMTERPTRIRTVRDTVPEGIDNAVARALAKVPADRFASASAFAATLAASAGGMVPSTRPARSRVPWVLGGVATLLLVAVLGLLVQRRGPDRARAFTPALEQMTTDGNARLPTLSPDGTRLAFVARDCDSLERCSDRVVVRDTGGAGSLTLLRGNAIWSLRWTTNGRFLAASVFEPDRFGLVVVPALGGTPRFLGCCFGMPIGASDTVLLSPWFAPPADSVVWLRFVTVSDGIVRDSVPVPKLGAVSIGYPARQSGRIAVVRYETPFAGSLWLLDRAGRITDSLPQRVQFTGFPNWSPDDAALLWSAPLGQLRMAAAYGSQPRAMIARRRVTAAGRFTGGADTLYRLPVGAGLSTVNADGTALLSQGPVDATVYALERARPGALGFRTRRLASSTAGLEGWLSRDGAQVLLSRPSDERAGTGRRDAIVPFEGGPERSFTAPPGDLFAWSWTRPVSSALLLASRDERAQVRLFEVSVSTGRVRQLDTLMASTEGLLALPGGGYLAGGFQSRFQQLRGRLSKPDTLWPHPPELGPFAFPMDVAHDGSAVVFGDMNVTADTIRLIWVPLDGRPTRPIATVTGGFPLTINLLPDGSLEYLLPETATTIGWYRIPPGGGRAVRLGDAPFQGTTAWSISDDGRRAVAVKSTDRPDVFLMRNFAELLRRR